MRTRQTIPFNVKTFTPNVRVCEFADMLLTQTFVGCDKDDMVKRCFILAVVQELMVVDVHDEGFACTGCHPEGEFIEVGVCEVCIHSVAGSSCAITGLNKSVELFQEFPGFIEFPI